MIKLISKSELETKKIASDFAKTLTKGSIVLLEGDLGAGKTAFVKGIVEFFGGDSDQVTSPTFTIVNQYNLNNQVVYHFDLYRIESVEELFNIGIEEYFYSGAICFIEWPERAPELFDETCKKIEILKKGDSSREIIIY